MPRPRSGQAVSSRQTRSEETVGCSDVPANAMVACSSENVSTGGLVVMSAAFVELNCIDSHLIEYISCLS